MRILHVIVGLDVGGAELMLKRLIDSQGSTSAYVHSVVSLTDVGPVGMQLRDSGIEVYALGMKSVLGFPAALFRLVGIIKARRPAVVQTWMYHADLIGGIAARMARKREVIWGIRTTDVRAAGASRTAWVRWICALLSRSVPRVIVCAAEASRRAHVAVGYDASKMVVVPNGFDLVRIFAGSEERAKSRSDCGFGRGEVVVGILGRFDPTKDHENFVRAAGLIARSHANVRFLLVGRGLDADNQELAGWISRTGCKERFVLLGQRADVPVCLAAMDVFCLSSRTEGFPNVVGEAMAMGLPCVVTDVGDAAMLVADTGYVVPKEDSAALAAGLEKMINLDSEARAALGAKAKQRIMAEFTIDRARERFESIYKSLTEK